MKRTVVVMICLYLSLVATANAQAVNSATARQLTVTAGVFGSGFDPGDSPNAIFGVGTYVDVHFTHWFQVEAEGRWLRFNQYAGEHQSNYLIGPKVPIRQFGRANAYGKVLIGLGKETFPLQEGYGSFTDLAYGGGIDYKVSRKITLRAVDFEYQQWPQWLNNQSLHPYGVSVGIGYRVF